MQQGREQGLHLLAIVLRCEIYRLCFGNHFAFGVPVLVRCPKRNTAS